MLKNAYTGNQAQVTAGKVEFEAQNRVILIEKVNQVLIKQVEKNLYLLFSF